MPSLVGSEMCIRDRSFLYLFGLFDAEEIVIPEPVTITETVTEKELVMPRVDSCLLYTSDAADE